MQILAETPSLSATDLQLIELYLEPELTPKQIAATLGISLMEVLSSVERPEITACIERLTALYVRRARDLAIALLPESIQRLQRIAETTKNDEVARKAASAIVRFALRRDTPGRAAQPRRPRDEHPASDEANLDAACLVDPADASSSRSEPEPLPSHARRGDPDPSDDPRGTHPQSADSAIPTPRTQSPSRLPRSTVQ